MRLESLNSELFQTLESEEMQKLQGGYNAPAGGTKGVDPNSMTGVKGQSGSTWDGEDPYTDA